jgi:GT2 family glycosyltransferase
VPASATEAPIAATATDAKPLVSIVILTQAPVHLPHCLESLRAQTYPADRREVIVVDNVSPEDPTDVVRQCYPGARVIRNPTNLGFAAGNNVGARAAKGDYIVFLNDDTRVHPEWLTELVATAGRRKAVSAASRVLNWDGERLDFVGGAVNCEGKGFQIDYDEPAAGRHLEEHPLLFACGAAMIVRRDVFLATGGFDEATFIYYEDVELGWRFWLLGHEVWSAPKSIVYHRHHGTTGRWAPPRRIRLYERNSLRMLYTHLERDTLARVLPSALMLACDRALLASAVSRASADDVERHDRGEAAGARSRLRESAARVKVAMRARGVSRRNGVWRNVRQLGARGFADAVTEAIRKTAAPAARADYWIERAAASAALDGRTESFPTEAAATLQGVHEFLESLPELTVRRAFLQSLRRRSDAEILSRFGSHWLAPVLAPHQREHEALHTTILETLGVAPLARAWMDP